MKSAPMPALFLECLARNLIESFCCCEGASQAAIADCMRSISPTAITSRPMLTAMLGRLSEMCCGRGLPTGERNPPA
jgi:hypothetical protein